jgi:hypothetical protein
VTRKRDTFQQEPKVPAEGKPIGEQKSIKSVPPEKPKEPSGQPAEKKPKKS